MSLKKIIWLLLIVISLTALTVMREQGVVDINLMKFNVDSAVDANHNNNHYITHTGLVQAEYAYFPVRVEVTGEHGQMYASALQSELQNANIRGQFKLAIVNVDEQGQDILPLYKWGKQTDVITVEYTMVRGELITSGDSEITIQTEHSVRGIASSINSQSIRIREFSRLLNKELLDHIKSLKANPLDIDF